MSDQSTAPDATPDDKPDTGDSTDWKAEAEKFKAIARKHEDRAKTNAQAIKELDQLKAASMSDLEKAVAEAKAAARTETLREVGGALAAAEIRAKAAGRLTDEQVANLIEGLNLAAFIDDEGQVDPAKVAKFVDGIAPQPTEAEAPTRSFLDLGQGARGGREHMALDSDPLMRDLKDKLNIR